MLVSPEPGTIGLPVRDLEFYEFLVVGKTIAFCLCQWVKWLFGKLFDPCCTCHVSVD